MSKKGYSRPGLFGDIHHYDEHGHKTGTSRPGLFGGYTNYDEHGHKTGRSEPGIFTTITEEKQVIVIRAYLADTITMILIINLPAQAIRECLVDTTTILHKVAM